MSAESQSMLIALILAVLITMAVFVLREFNFYIGLFLLLAWVLMLIERWTA